MGILLFALAAAAVITLFALSVTIGLPRHQIVALALGTGLYVFAGLFLIYQWIHGDYERYIWIIGRSAPCTYMGGGPYQLWMAVGIAAFGLTALMVAAACGLDRQAARDGIAVAVALTLATALAMFPEPAVFATLLGCV